MVSTCRLFEGCTRRDRRGYLRQSTNLLPTQELVMLARRIPHEIIHAIKAAAIPNSCSSLISQTITLCSFSRGFPSNCRHLHGVSRAGADTCSSCCFLTLRRHLLLKLFLEPMQTLLACTVFRATPGTFFWIPP